jgi:hypothetical protein
MSSMGDSPLLSSWSVNRLLTQLAVGELFVLVIDVYSLESV